jgi:hypothetical protein
MLKAVSTIKECIVGVILLWCLSTPPIKRIYIDLLSPYNLVLSDNYLIDAKLLFYKRHDNSEDEKK